MATVVLLCLCLCNSNVFLTCEAWHTVDTKCWLSNCVNGYLDEKKYYGNTLMGNR